jgi:hypothetical protein
VIVRLLVLIVAVLLVAAPAERACAELCPDAPAEIVDLDAPAVQLPATTSPPAHAATALARSRGHSIAPAPSGARIFRPPRSSLV